MPVLKAILFDVDGTLAETEEFHRLAFNAAFEEAGLDVQWSPEQYRELLKVTGGKERLAAFFRSRSQTSDAGLIGRLHEIKNRRYGEAIAGGSLQLRPGVLRLMREAQDAGVLLGIATTTSYVNLDALLRPLLGEDWAQAFACVVAGDQVASKKPAPDVYLACLERLRLVSSEVVAIEDSAAGLRAAHAAGIAVVVAPSRYTDTDDFSRAERLFEHLGDPQTPWEGPMAAGGRSYLRLADLQALAQGHGAGILTRPEMAQ